MIKTISVPCFNCGETIKTYSSKDKNVTYLDIYINIANAIINEEVDIICETCLGMFERVAAEVIKENLKAKETDEN